MTPQEASMILGHLVGVTNGWGGDETEANLLVGQYQEEFELLSDPIALHAAVRQVVNSRHDTFRPPVREILDAYQATIRQIQARTALPAAPETIAPWREGVEIARRAYHAECHRQGREPNDPRFESMLAWAMTPVDRHAGSGPRLI